ncbi:hypothetical protein TWF730_009866 [Orbilia blumenaviensis]|uniref:Uncharacterized protein n=1 Tax=Orbilia blumenaviensis TaxID=1796055 RepID=A0AAV9UUF8_9PEZI
MMHPPVSPGSSNVLVNGGKVAAGSERASIDGIPQPSKNSSMPAETVGNCVDNKSHGAGKMQNKDTGVQKPEIPNGRPPPRATPTHISDIRLPSNKANGGTSTGGFVPLQLTSPTESTDYEGRLALNEEEDMAAKSPTEPPAPVIVKGGSKKSDPKNGTKPKTQPTPPKIEELQNHQPANMPSETSPTAVMPNGTPSTPPNPSSGAPYIDDSDSEDEELQELLTQKRDQIRRDIAHYQRSKEMELLVYEKRLRDDLMRRKRRKQAQANGRHDTAGSPRSHYSLSTKSNIGTLPGYLPLTPTLGGTAPARPSGLRKMVESKHEDSERSEGIEKMTLDAVVPTDVPDQAEPKAEPKPAIVVRSPPNTRAASKPHKGSPALSPVSPSPNHHSLPPQAPTGAKLSASALKALEGTEKAPLTLPSSLKSTSSWTSGSGKDSRRSSVNDTRPKKNKHVVFQLEVEGNFFRVKPDGEEIPMDPEEKERLRAEALTADIDYDSDSESDYLEFKVPSSKAASKVPEQDTGYNTIEDLEGVPAAAAKPNKGPEDPDWISTKPVVEPKVRSAKSTISDDSIEDDVFDLDEEIPYGAPTAVSEFASGSLEDSVMSLGLPLAPPPPPPPGGSGIALPPAFGVGRAGGSFADTLAYIQAYQQAGISRGSSVSGSYLSSSFPRNSFGGTSSSWREPSAPAPPRPSSSHAAPSAPSAPVTIGRRASGGVDLVMAPTLEMLSSSLSGSVGQAGATLSGSLPVGSGFRRRSVTKYDIPDEDVKDSSASSSVTSKSDLLAEVEVRPKPALPSQVSMPAPTRKSVPGRTISEEGRKASPYGTSAPISIPPRSASVPPVVTETVVAPEQAKDDVPKEPEMKLKRNLSFRQLLLKRFWKQPRKL